MNGRVFDPRIGQFLSRDPIVRGWTNGQSWNRYSYVGNQATSFSDPSAYEPSINYVFTGYTKNKVSRRSKKHLQSGNYEFCR